MRAHGTRARSTASSIQSPGLPCVQRTVKIPIGHWHTTPESLQRSARSPAQYAQPSAQPCASCGTSRRGLTRLLEPEDDTLFPRSLSNDNLFRLSCNTTKIRQRKGLQFVQEIYHITDIRELSPKKTVCSTFIKGVTQPSVTFLGQGPSLLI